MTQKQEMFLQLMNKGAHSPTYFDVFRLLPGFSDDILLLKTIFHPCLRSNLSWFGEYSMLPIIDTNNFCPIC